MDVNKDLGGANFRDTTLEELDQFCDFVGIIKKPKVEEGWFSVYDIADRTKVPRSQVQRKLLILYRAGKLLRKRYGKLFYYREKTGDEKMPDITIIIPHKRTPLNDQALQLNLQMINENTRCSYELIIDTTEPANPYEIWNKTARMARAPVLVFSNSDVLLAPDWDVHLVDHLEDNSISVVYLVEPGTIGVAAENIKQDFGREPASFDREAFEKYVKVIGRKVPEIKEERGWYMPCAVYRDWFAWTGGFDLDEPFPSPADIRFWNRCRDDYGTKFLRARSFAYHFQNLSAR